MIDQLPMKPSLTPTIWGPDGGFPFISNWLGRIFLDQKSLDHFLSWLHWFYHNALKGDPRSGHAIFMAGGPGIGKTLLSRYLIGKMVGGSADATRYLMDRDGFGGHLFEVPLWGVDDQGMTNSNFTIRQFTANVKRMIANKSHEFHNKYQRPVQILWDGRLFVTCNLDAWSMAVLPSLEDSIMDKVCFYRLIDNLTEGQILPAGFFPADVEKVIDGELAAFCRFIDDWVIPAEFVGDARYGIVYYQDEVMAQASFFNSGTSHFFEVIQIYMASYTKCMRKNVKEGTASDLLAEMTADEQCRHLVRGMNVTTFGRHLQNLSQFRPNLISSVINESGLRVWKITWNNEEPKQ